MSEIKSVLRQMIDNNKPHWRPETIRGAHKMLDEYEAKAKAFDVLYAEFDRDDMNLSKADFDEALEYESGESVD